MVDAHASRDRANESTSLLGIRNQRSERELFDPTLSKQSRISIAAMRLSARLLRHRPPMRRHGFYNQLHTSRSLGSETPQRALAGRSSADDGAKRAEWDAQAHMIGSGARNGMLAILEDRGLVKDVAG